MTKLVIYEGLLAGTALPAYVYEGLVKQLDQSKFVLERRTFKDVNREINLKGVETLIIAGHSLGAEEATKAANKIGKTRAVHLFTMDARINNLFLSLPWWALGSLSVELKVIAVNFRHHPLRGFFPGLSISGADNRPYSLCNHTQLPGMPEVVKAVKSVIDGKGG